MGTVPNHLPRVKRRLAQNPNLAPPRRRRRRKAHVFRDTGERGGRGRPFNAVDFARVLRFLKDGRPLGLEEARGLIKKCGTRFPWFLAQR